MRNWFTCQVKYQKVDQDGQESKHNEQYLVDAMTYTEAEARINFIMAQRSSGLFLVDKITKNNYSEVVNLDDSDKWFKVKVSMVSYDDETEQEKTSNRYILVAADDVQDAFIKTQQIMKGSITGYVIPSITYMKILEVFFYEEGEQVEREMAEKGFKPISEIESSVQEVVQTDDGQLENSQMDSYEE